MTITTNTKLPTCKLCNDFGCYSRQKLCGQIGCSYNQPERSKREDVLETTDKVVAMASMHRAMPAFNFVVNKRCGTLNTDESQ